MVFPGEGLENLVWTEEHIRNLELDEDKFPPFVEYGELIGTVTETAANNLHIAGGVPVFACGPDFMMSILGTATVTSGKACDRAGTSEGINVCIPRRLYEKRLLCYRHITPGFWNIAGIISTSGKALEWYGDSLLGGSFSYEKLDEMAAEAVPGAQKLIFLPYLSGERTPIWDPYARGVFSGLGLHHSTRDLARAVLESTGFAIRDVLSLIAENGIEVSEMTVAGSPAKSDTWNRIKADITGKNILVPENLESELVGDACMAMYRLGRHASPTEAALDLVKIQKVIEPRLENRQMYTDLYGVYRDTYAQLKPVFKKMAGIENRGSG
jgi:xylulokinase